MIKPNDTLCDCNCATPCPLGKIASENRCKISDLMAHFYCARENLEEELNNYREVETLRRNARLGLIP